MKIFNELTLDYIHIRSVIVLALLLTAEHILAQKPFIDTSVYGKWPGSGPGYLSNDGEYYYYEVYYRTGHRLIIKGTHKAWEKEITDVKSRGSFANDGHLLIAKHGQDSLCLQTLGSDQQEFIPHVSSFKVSQQGKAEWLIYQLSNPDKELTLRNLCTGRQQSFSKVTAYQFGSGDLSLILQQQLSDSTLSLGWLELGTGVSTPIWQGKSVGILKFAPDGKGLAFVGTSDIPDKAALWYYKAGDEKAQMLFIENSSGLTKGLTILDDDLIFDSAGDKLFFSLQPIRTNPVPNPGLASVDIYRQTEDLQKQDFILVAKDNGGDAFGEWNWNHSALTSVYLVSAADGTRKCLCKDQPNPIAWSYRLSPNDRFVVNTNNGTLK
jgi:hypothetical protein